nr:MAG TPA: hypothetical protein [Caudoviricetes sp.]
MLKKFTMSIIYVLIKMFWVIINPVFYSFCVPNKRCMEVI